MAIEYAVVYVDNDTCDCETLYCIEGVTQVFEVLGMLHYSECLRVTVCSKSSKLGSLWVELSGEQVHALHRLTLH